jgi:hypothetical protein
VLISNWSPDNLKNGKIVSISNKWSIIFISKLMVSQPLFVENEHNFPIVSVDNFSIRNKHISITYYIESIIIISRYIKVQ